MVLLKPELGIQDSWYHKILSFQTVPMVKRSPFDSSQIMRRTEDLIRAASNRYRITVQVANRAQRRRFEDFDNYEDPKMKPVLRAIIEMSDELTQPEIIGE
jgi:DNA-directed RNA polymerase subunit omega